MSNRIPLIAGNWKMYKTCPEAVAEAKKLVAAIGGLTDRQAMIAPTFPALAPVFEVLKGTPISLGAQDLYWEKEGAFTGEISAQRPCWYQPGAPMLLSVTPKDGSISERPMKR